MVAKVSPGVIYEELVLTGSKALVTDSFSLRMLCDVILLPIICASLEIKRVQTVIGVNIGNWLS